MFSSGCGRHREAHAAAPRRCDRRRLDWTVPSGACTLTRRLPGAQRRACAAKAPRRCSGSVMTGTHAPFSSRSTATGTAAAGRHAALRWWRAGPGTPASGAWNAATCSPAGRRRGAGAGAAGGSAAAAGRDRARRAPPRRLLRDRLSSSSPFDGAATCRLFDIGRRILSRAIRCAGWPPRPPLRLFAATSGWEGPFQHEQVLVAAPDAEARAPRRGGLRGGRPARLPHQDAHRRPRPGGGRRRGGPAAGGRVARRRRHARWTCAADWTRGPVRALRRSVRALPSAAG